MTGRRRQQLRSLVALAVIACAGIAAAAYVLLKERAPVPFEDTYELRAEVAAADGIEPGLGQPVRVAGVQVGAISDLELRRGNAVVTMRIERAQLPRVYANARVSLAPITPLEDMQAELDPGRPPARPLPDGATVGIAPTDTPVPLSDLLSALDGDTRAFLSSLLASLREGTRGRGPDIRGALIALGPTTEQLGRVSDALASRRRALARLVHNLALVTRAASRDRELAALVGSANRTLSALAEQDQPLREAIRRLPGTLETTGSTLTEVGAFARELDPALTSLLPAVRRLPDALGALRPFARTGARELSRSIRPFVAEAIPAVRDLGPASADLRVQMPNAITGLKGINYALNELAYNPPGEKNGFADEGFLYWAAWWFHNYNSLFSAKDAHGGAARAMVMVNCQQITGLAGLGELLKLVIGTYNLCPES